MDPIIIAQVLDVIDDEQEFRVMYDAETGTKVKTVEELKRMPREVSEEIIGLEVEHITVSDNGVLNIYIKG